jgi:hypothetical protein
MSADRSTVAAVLHKRRILIGLALLAAFAFRLAFGLSSEFWFEDETQIFLLGFRHHATGQWPFFGADVVWTKSEIPGALQALLVGVPLDVVSAPEAPFVLLNLLSFAALAFFCVYLCRRLPTLPRWLVWGWLFTIPWTLQFSTHVINPSYVLAGAVVFFIGFFEALPSLSTGWIGRPVAHFMMGAATTWVMQIHMSWPLLMPFAGVAWMFGGSESLGARVKNAAAYLAGAAVPGLLLLPTLMHYGRAGLGGTARNIQLHFVNPYIIVTTVARLFSFASLEIVRFIATDNAKRIEFFEQHRWLIPFAAVVWAVGIVQPIWMLIEFFRSRGRSQDERAQWRAIRWLVAAAVVAVYASYWFAFEPPQAHAFYVLAPIIWLFAAECWTHVDSPRMRTAAAAILIVSLAFHAGLAAAQAPDRSMYKHREIVTAALAAGDPEMFGHRRAFAIDGGPAALSPATYNPLTDIAIDEATFSIGPLHSLRWRVTVSNRSADVAYRDLLYIATYIDRDGRTLDERHEFIKDVIEPGRQLTLDLNDGTMDAPIAATKIAIVAAEALRPARAPSR